MLILAGIPACSGLSWTIENVDEETQEDGQTSLVLGPGGCPCIGYYDSKNQILKFAAKDAASGWTLSSIDESGSAGSDPSLAVNSWGIVGACYSHPDTGSLHYASRNGTQWSARTVASFTPSNSLNLYPALAFDANGNPHIAYYDTGSRSLMHAEWNGMVWNMAAVDSSPDTGYYPAIAPEADGNVRIVYHDHENGRLMTAAGSKDVWETEVLNSHPPTGIRPSIAIDANGHAHISYYDEATTCLKYISWADGAWHDEIADGTAGTGYYNSLAIGPDQMPHIAYYDAPNHCLKYASRNETRWQDEVVDGHLVDTGKYCCLKISDTCQPSISYIDSTNNRLKFATGCKLAAGFNAQPVTGIAPLEVQFTDATESNGAITSWNWSFGDGTWFNTTDGGLRHPSHVYVIPGTYAISLFVSEGHMSSTQEKPGHIIVLPPMQAPAPHEMALMAVQPPHPAAEPPEIEAAASDHAVTEKPASSGPGVIAGDSSVSVPSGYPAVSSQESVNVGGESAISKVTVTGTGISSIIVTGILRADPGPSCDPPSGQVYQYIDLTPARYSSISSVTVEFSVPGSWLESRHLAPNDVTLYHQEGKGWKALPLLQVRIHGDTISYTAQSPGFSLYAIAAGPGQPLTPPAVTGSLPNPVGPEQILPIEEAVAPDQTVAAEIFSAPNSTPAEVLETTGPGPQATRTPTLAFGFATPLAAGSIAGIAVAIGKRGTGRWNPKSSRKTP
jgi:PGF-pre-PGF domain-containing protein